MTGGPLCFGEQGVERFREFGLEPDSGVGVLVGQHEDLLEEGLVEQPPDVLGGAEVGIVGVGGEVQRKAEGLPSAHDRAQSIPLRRPGYPDDIAKAVLFLASDEAAYITGETINVTGGLWND